MLPKKVVRLFTLISCSLVGVGAFQNCADQAQFSLVESLDLASSIDIGQNQNMDHLSHSGADHVPPTQKASDIEYSPVVMDRIGLVNLFADVFGPRAIERPAVRSIARDPNIFGGGCSFYSQSGKTPTDMTTFCSNTNAALSVKPLMGVTVLRQGRINQACHELVNNNDTLTYILKRIENNNTFPAVTLENAQSLFALFYRARAGASEGLYESMVANITPANKEGWKRAIYGVCVSGHWQVL